MEMIVCQWAVEISYVERRHSVSIITRNICFVHASKATKLASHFLSQGLGEN
jgi:hypothetical protein